MQAVHVSGALPDRFSLPLSPVHFKDRSAPQIPPQLLMPPAAAFAYGSFGDIITTAQLVVKIVEVLRRRGRPSSTCAELEKDLKTIHGDLMRLRLQTSPLDLILTARVKDEIARCRLIMDEFDSKTAAPRSWLQTILWANSEDRELAAFRIQVIEHRAALSVVVGLVNSCVVACYASTCALTHTC